MTTPPSRRLTPRLGWARLRSALALARAAAPGRCVALGGLALAEGVVPVAGVWALKFLLDELARGRAASGDRVVAAAAALAATGLLLSLRQAADTYVAATLRRAVQLTASERLFARVDAEPGLEPFENPAYLDRLRLAEQGGQSGVEELVDAAFAVVRNALMAVGYGLTLLVLWPPMLAVLGVATVPSVVLNLRMGRLRAALLADLSPVVRRQLSFRELLTDARAAKEVRLFGLGRYLQRRMLDLLARANRAHTAMDVRALRAETALELVAATVTVTAVAVAAHRAMRGELSVGDVAIFLATVGGAYSAGSATASAVAAGYHGLLVYGPFHELTAAADGAARPLGAVAAPPLRRGIELDRVWFRYTDDGPWVLRGVSLTIPYGAAVGLVGLNGAGKSTLVKLLTRMYEPTHGAIRWDGVDLRELEPASLRSRITAVFQDFMAYDLTAAENVGVGRLDALDDPAALTVAARLAEVHDVLAALPSGYRTMLSRSFDDSEGTALLSGGQWQRIAIARAFLRTGADLTVLDEPSAGLDAEAEEAVHATLRRLRTGRTSLLVSHRLSTLRHADLIHVLDDGVVLEHGTHATLMAAGGRYAALFRLQAEGYRDVPTG